jgi:hypothetical protein
MQASTQCFMFLGSNGAGLKSFPAQALVEPVTSRLSEHEACARAHIIKAKFDIASDAFVCESNLTSSGQNRPDGHLTWIKGKPPARTSILNDQTVASANAAILP